MVGEASGPAEAHGVRAGVRLGEALARCPELVLVPADPLRAERAWEQVTMRLEEIGAAVFSERAGEAFFEVDGLRGLWGGDADGVLARARKAVEMPVRLGAGPSPFCAYAAAERSRPGRPVVVPRKGGRRFLAPLPVSLLRSRVGAELPERLDQLGVRTLGALAKLSADAVADRFGEPGLLALKLARGEAERLRPRRPRRAPRRRDRAAGGPPRLTSAARRRAADRPPARRSRAPRPDGAPPAALGAACRGRRLALRAGDAPGELRAADAAAGARRRDRGAARAGRAAAPRGDRARASGGGPAHPDPLLSEERRNRLGEAVRQVRAAAGSESVLRVLDVDPESRLPERRAVLTPYAS